MIRDTFGLDQYGARLRGIYASVVDSRPGSVGALDRKTVANSFLQADRISLLRT